MKTVTMKHLINRADVLTEIAIRDLLKQGKTMADNFESVADRMIEVIYSESTEIKGLNIFRLDKVKLREDVMDRIADIYLDMLIEERNIFGGRGFLSSN